MFKILKKSIISLLVFAMVLCMIPVNGFTSTAAAEVWDGGLATGYAGGSGTKSSPYTIGNAKQLALLAEKVNTGVSYSGVYFKLTANIVLNDTAGWSKWGSTVTPTNTWTAIGTDTDYPFSGCFDGDGYTISGVYINNENDHQGLFGYCYNATLKNFGVINSFVKCDWSGGAIGVLNNSTLTNCYNKGTVSGTGNHIGGVVGYVTNATVTGCYNTGIVSGDGYNIGGVVGFNCENSTVKDCYNIGSVIGKDSFAGGVVGRSYSKNTVISCYNTGTISGNNYVGGVIGVNYGNSTVTSCYNKGTINGNNYIGGVNGFNENSDVTRCYNNGIISGNNNIGGIVGYNHSSATVSSCYNTGKVSGNDYIGGVVGFIEGSNVAGCYNTAAISGNNYIGGVVGVNYENSSVAGCYNIGSVSVTGSNIGGVIGYNYSSVVKNCYYLNTSVKTPTDTNGTVLTAVQMKSQSNFKGFDFSKTWKAIGSYPILNGVGGQHTAHKYSKKTAAATTANNGKVVYSCSGCGYTKTTTIYKIKTVTLAKSSVTYTGKAIKPAVSVKDSKGNVLKSGTDYTVTYKNNTNPGKATATVTFKGSYSGKKTLAFVINPTGTAVKSIKSGDKCFTVYWSKNSIASGYEIQYSAASSFSGAKSFKATGSSTISNKISGLSSGKKYYVRVRVFKTVDKTNYYSSWSAAKTVTVQQSKEIKIISKSNPAGSYKISIKWAAVSGASGYEISCYSFSDKEWLVLTNTKTTSYSGVWTGWSNVKLRIRAVFVDKNSKRITYGPWSETLTFKHK